MLVPAINKFILLHLTPPPPRSANRLSRRRKTRALRPSHARVGDVAARWIAKLKKLTSLTLADTDVGNEGVENLARGAKELVHLDLGHTLVDDEGVDYLKKIKFLIRPCYFLRPVSCFEYILSKC
jgi:hypothetical protein